MAKNKEYQMAIKIAGEIEKSFYNSTKLTKKELASIAKQAGTTSTSVAQTFSKGLKDAAPAFQGIEKAGKAAFDVVAKAATAATAATAAVVGAAVSVGAPFEAQMSTVEAISLASSAEMGKLTDLAKELGSTTQYTATQAGQAMEYMAMAGWKTNDMLAGMDGVLSLAAASGEDLATTSDIVTDAMTALGMGADEVNRFSNVLAATVTNSNATVSEMGESFKYAASLAGTMKYSIEDVSIAFGLMASSGTKASQAGTALRKLITETTEGINISSKALGEHFIATQKTDGSMRALKDVVEDLRNAFSDDNMTDAEKSANAKAIAGQTGMAGLLTMVNATEADYGKLTNAIYNSAGAAEKMAEIRLDNLSGDATIMKSAFEGLGIQIYEDLNEPLRVGVQWMTELIGKISTKLSNSGFMEDITAKIPTAVRKIKELTGAAQEFLKPFFAIGGWLIDNPGLLVGTIVALGTALTIYKVASGIMSLVSALGALGPVGITILGIAGVVGVITGISTAIKKSAEVAKKANLAAHFGNISLSLSDLEEVAGSIVGSDDLRKVREAIAAFDDLDNLQNTIDSSVSAINKMNWKVSIGMELTESEKEDYQSNIGSYIQQCQQYVTDKQFAVNLSVGFLTDKDLEGYNIVNQINDFYAGKRNELSELGTELNEVITDAFQDGLLDMDEAARISEIQADMAKIQANLAGANFEAGLEAISLHYGGELDAESFQNLQAEVQEQVAAAKIDYEDAFRSATASELAMLNDGKISQEDYDNTVGIFKDNYLKQVNDLELKAANFQLDTIISQYKTELDAVQPELDTIKNDALQYAEQVFSAEGMGSTGNRLTLLQLYIAEMIGDSETIGQDTKDALSELMESMKPLIEQIEDTSQQYRDNMEAIPQDVSDTMNRITELGAITGDASSLWKMTGEVLLNNDDYTNMLSEAGENGSYIPEEISNAILDNKAVLETTANELYNDTVFYLKKEFSEGIDMDAPIRVKLKAIYDASNATQSTISTLPVSNNVNRNLPGYASGGFIQNPTLAWFAEDGPEAAIPLDKSQNAIDLWLKTGELLGMENNKPDGFSSLTKEINNNPVNNQSSMNIEFKPTMNFYGDTPKKEDLEAAFDSEFDKFSAMMKRYERENNRLCFS